MRLAGLLLLLASCTDPGAPTGAQITSHTSTMPLLPAGWNNRLDVLFVIDHSPATAEQEAHLEAALPAALEALASDAGSLPDLHIAVVSAQGDGRIDQFFTDAPLITGERVRNYTGSLAEAFRAQADLGASSASPSRLLDVAYAALDPALNPEFVRGRATVVVFVSATDDASSGVVLDYAEQLKSRYSDPTYLMVNVIAGPREGESTCGATESPRLHDLVVAFPYRSTATAICDQDLRPALADAPRLLKATLDGRCWQAAPLDLDPLTVGPQRDCTAFLADREHVEETAIVVDECGETPTFPCWRIIDEPFCGQFGSGLGWPALSTRVEPVGMYLPNGTMGQIECVVDG